MPSSGRRIFEFDSFRLDPADGSLRAGEARVPLPPKAFDTLRVLVENAGRLVTKEELLERVWPDTFVAESTLTQNVFLLRKALGESEARKFIETVPKRGYRFTARVTELDESPAPSAPVVAPPPDPVPVPIATPRARAALRVAGFAALVLAAAIGAGTWIEDRARAQSGDAVHTLAVLPFRVVVGDEKSDFLGVGLSDALTGRLGEALPEVIVRPTTSVLKYGKEWIDPLDAGRLLRVDAVLDGTIQNADGRIRVHLRLLRVADGRTLWSDDVDGHVGDLFAVEDAIAGRAARYLSAKLGGAAETARVERPTTSSNAYQAYLLGRYFWNHRPVGLEKAVSYFEQAIELDPRYAEAYAGLANCYNILQSPDDIARATVLAEQAARLDPTLADPHVVLAIASMRNLQWNRAEREFERALQLDPHNAEAHLFYTLFLISQRRTDEAVRACRRAVELDPTSAPAGTTLGAAYIYDGRPHEAVPQLEKTLDFDPFKLWTRLRLAQAHLLSGDIDSAIAEGEKVRALSEEYGGITLATAYAMKGDRETALRYMREGGADAPAGEYRRATAFAALGDHDRAFESLRQLIRNRHSDVYAIPVDRRLDPLRKDPRFQQILAEANLR